MDRVAYSYLMGNADAHAKNLSLLHSAAGIRLAPAYDVLSTAVYPHLKKDMALSINRMFDGNALRPIHWKKAFSQLGLFERLYAERFAALAERVLAAVPDARAELDSWVLRNGVLDGVVAVVSARAEFLKGLRDG